MMTRQEILQSLVITAMANDYEDFEMILHETLNWAPQKGLTVAREEVIEALEQLIEDGYAQAWVLSPTSPAEVVPYSRENLDNLYFYVTPRGRELVHKYE